MGDAEQSKERKRLAQERNKAMAARLQMELEQQQAQEDELFNFKVGDIVDDSGNTLPNFNEPSAIAGRILARRMNHNVPVYDIRFTILGRTYKDVTEARLS